MSRAAAVGTVTTTSNDLHLIIGHGPKGPVLTVSKTPVPGSITITPDDYRTFCLYMLHIFRVKTWESSLGLPFGKPVRIDDTLKDVLYFLYAGIAKRVAPGLSEHEQLEHTAVALYSSGVTIPPAYYQKLQRPPECNPGFNTAYFDPATWNTPGRCFFAMSAVQRVTASPDHKQLLKLTLNAVEKLDRIEDIIKNTHPEELPILLSAKGTATIDHLEALNPPHSFKRTGTALQMAIYGDDEGVQALLKEYIDPAEYERQAIEAFSTVLSDDVKQKLAAEKAPAVKYLQEADAQQKEDAKNLCAKLEAAMRAATPTEFICVAPNYVASTTSASVTAATVQFKKDLLDYTQKNPLHNRYILERLHEINISLEKQYYYCFERDCFLSQQGITEAQLLMSERWVQHYARGTCYIAEDRDELARRTSTCRSDTAAVVDIHSVMSRLRSKGRSLGMFGKRRIEPRAVWGCEFDADFYQILCRAKQYAVGACYAAKASMGPQA